jgi:uncharacterized protein YcnI
MATMTRRLVICVAALMLIAQPAWAHVSVSPPEAARGSLTTFTFTVPNEEAPAKTTKVEVFFPDGAAFAEVNPQPLAGWTQSKTETSAAWEGGSIAGEDEVDFQLELGPLPNGEALTFRVLQTYDNGEVVRWIDAPLPGGGEPDHPAPVVRLTGAAVLPSTTTRPGATTTLAAESDDDDGFGGTGLFVLIVAVTAVLAIGVGVAVQRASPRTR